MQFGVDRRSSGPCSCQYRNNTYQHFTSKHMNQKYARSECVLRSTPESFYFFVFTNSTNLGHSGSFIFRVVQFKIQPARNDRKRRSPGFQSSQGEQKFLKIIRAVITLGHPKQKMASGLIFGTYCTLSYEGRSSFLGHGLQTSSTILFIPSARGTTQNERPVGSGNFASASDV